MSGPGVQSAITRQPRRGFARKSIRYGILLLLVLLGWASGPPAQAAVPFSPGDLVVGLGSSPDGSSRGELRHFSPSGTLLDTLLTTSGSFEETGACFDAARNLYTTNFEANTMSKFGPDGARLQASFGSGFNQYPNSCVVNSVGNVLVGLADRDGDWGGGGVLVLNPAGVVQGSFSPVPDGRGTDWIDLADDDCTLYYTSVGASIKRFDVCTDTQLPDFCTACDDGAGGVTFGTFFGLRVLSDGGVLVADWNFAGNSGLVRRYNSAGTQVMAYTATDAYGSQCGPDGAQPCFYPWALALSPDHASVWVADNVSGEIFQFDLAGGGILGSFVGGECSDFYSSCAVTGLAVVGERAGTGEPPSGGFEVTASITAANKVYDGTTEAAITSCTLSGVVGADDVGCVASGGAFATASVGNDKPVSATVSLTGSAASQYVLASAEAATTADITPKPASVTPNAASKTYGDPDPTFAGSLSGFLAADTVSATYTRTPGETVAGGPYTISATLSPANALGNYSVTYNTASLTIARANASVTPNAASKIYGTADPVLAGTLSGFLAGDNVTATYSRGAGETVAGGPYTITATLSPAAALDNYTVAYNTAAFTIGPAPASVTPNPATKTYGTADPILTGTLNGFLAADGVTATYSRTPGENVAGGPYTISATLSPAAALGNYAVNYDTAGFSITPATPIVIWADPADITYPTPLGSTQLNATANVPGTFAYTPPAGTVLNPGPSQLLSVLLTPTDSSNYTTASAEVHINVLSSDVAVSLSTSTPVVYVGATVSYDLVVAANGPGGSSDVVLTDTLPLGLDWTVSGPDAAACTPSSPVAGGTTLTCSFGTVAAGTTKAVTLTSVTTTTGCGDVLDTAVVSATGDSNPDNNSAGPVTITVNCPALSVSKSTTTPVVSAGDTVSYDLTVTAGGTGNSTNVQLTDTLPPGLSWTVTGPDAAACAPASPVPGGTTLTCTYGTLSPGDKRNITVTAVTTGANCGAISNTATVTDTLAILPGENSAGPVAIEVDCPQVSVVKSTSTPVVDAGDSASYTVVVTGLGPGYAYDVTLIDQLPDGLDWTVGGPDAADCSAASPVAGGTTLSCSFGTIAPGATRTVTLTALTSTANCGVINNTATVTTAADTAPGRNSSGPVAIAVNCPVPPSVETVRLSCPNVSLIGDSFEVSGALSPGSENTVTLQYTSPSGVTTSQTTQSNTTGEYSDSFTPQELGEWTVSASSSGVDSPDCPIVVYGKSEGGSFVIGDLNAVDGNTVEFWGAEWWMTNDWTSGVKPGDPSLKGYLDALELPGSCDGFWSTRPGNSSKPPETIPSYMAVIASSKITKNGPTIAGDAVALVVVKTDPGYWAAPGHRGHGTIVATICPKPK
jgi:uncharacterized repeat protein (TIGR01451 family)